MSKLAEEIAMEVAVMSRRKFYEGRTVKFKKDIATLIDEKLSGGFSSCRRAIYDRILELEPSGDSSARNDIGGSDNLTKWPMEKLDEYLAALLPDPKLDNEDKDTEQAKVD